MKIAAIVFATISCIVVPIYGQAASKDSAAHQKPAKATQAPNEIAAPPSQAIKIDTVNVNKINVPLQDESDGKSNENRNKPASYLCRLFAPENLPNLILCIIGIAGVIAAYYTFGEMRANTAIAKRTLVLAQRPRIRVNAFYFSEIRGVGSVQTVTGMQNPFRNGQFYILNHGGTKATIQEIYCDVLTAINLPMKRPYEGKVGSQEKKVLLPGQSTFYTFGSFNPIETPTLSQINQLNQINYGQADFYVLGWIGYTDDLGIYRITAFCRRYDSTKDRFVPVDDADYEYAD